MPSTDNILESRPGPYVIKNQKAPSRGAWMPELVLYGIRLLVQASLGTVLDMEVTSLFSHQTGVDGDESCEEVPTLLAVLHHHLVGLELVAGYPGLPPPGPGYVTPRGLQSDHLKASPGELLS